MTTRPDRASGLLLRYTGDAEDAKALGDVLCMVRGIAAVRMASGSRLVVVFKHDVKTGSGECGPALFAVAEGMRKVTSVEWIEAAPFSGVETDVRTEASEALYALVKKIGQGDKTPKEIDGRYAIEVRTRVKVADELVDRVQMIVWGKKQ